MDTLKGQKRVKTKGVGKFPGVEKKLLEVIKSNIATLI